MQIIAIDPGASGGIAWQDEEKFIHVEPMPETESDIVHQLRSIAAVSICPRCYLEKVGACFGPNLPVSRSAMFNFGQNYGLIRGALIAIGVPIQEVRPQEWQKALHVGVREKGTKQHEWKNKLKAQAQLLFPTLDVTLKTADALLIFKYATLQPQ